MKIISLVSQKGGVGKTTIALHLATAFTQHGYAAVVLDLDPQASAAEWRDYREAELPAVESIQAARLGRMLQESEKAGADIVIIDTAPHSEGTALEAARLASLIIVPCQPSIMDLRAMRKTIDLLQMVQAPKFALLNGVTHTGAGVADEAATALAGEFGIPVVPIRIGERVAYNRCLITGLAAQEYEPGGKAASEVQALYEWACQQLDMPPTRRAGAKKKGDSSGKANTSRRPRTAA